MLARMEDRNHFESRVLSVPLPQRTIDNSSIALGPQGGLARGMSIRGQALISNIEIEELRCLSHNYVSVDFRFIYVSSQF